MALISVLPNPVVFAHGLVMLGITVILVVTHPSRLVGINLVYVLDLHGGIRPGRGCGETL